MICAGMPIACSEPDQDRWGGANWCTARDPPSFGVDRADVNTIGMIEVACLTAKAARRLPTHKSRLPDRSIYRMRGGRPKACGGARRQQSALCHKPMAIGASRPTIHHREPTGRRRQYCHGVGGARRRQTGRRGCPTIRPSISCRFRRQSIRLRIAVPESLKIGTLSELVALGRSQLTEWSTWLWASIRPFAILVGMCPRATRLTPAAASSMSFARDAISAPLRT
jgi:hypothetical protein